LENAVTRAVVCAAAESIEPGDLPPELIGGKGTMENRGDWWSDLKAQNPGGDLLGAAEKMLVERALQEAEGNVLKGAKILGVTRSAFRTRLERYGINHNNLSE
jgi:DNA-binding NtrC family response regulator